MKFFLTTIVVALLLIAAASKSRSAISYPDEGGTPSPPEAALLLIAAASKSHSAICSPDVDRTPSPPEAALLLIAAASKSRSAICSPDVDRTPSPPEAGSLAHTNKKIPLIRTDKPKEVNPMEYLTHDLARMSVLLGTPIFYPSEYLNITARDRTSDLDMFTAWLGFGYPDVLQKVVFDTGSDFSWIRCNMTRINSTESYQGASYAPADSFTSKLVFCGSSNCLKAGGRCKVGGNDHCFFSTHYMDASSTQGIVFMDELNLTYFVSVKHFLFGCATSDVGYFGDLDGLIGLGRGPMSLAQQIHKTDAPSVDMTHNEFSYCIPSSRSKKSGFLTFGRMDESTSDITFTKMFRHRTHMSLYFVDLTYMYVGNEFIAMPVKQETFVDSGATLTYIPPEVHGNLTRVFRQEFEKYLIPKDVYILGGCFNFTDAPANIPIPQVIFGFSDGTEFDLSYEGIFFNPRPGKRIACLAFHSQSGISIIGRSAQQSVEIVFDIVNDNLGFGPKGGC
ncbi:hypothetical protein CFC21_038494 [Triticum aestivum]|uniref:Peptidase A1 domain-containing protein n=2 Tax=Triticum aestivum TaxID=4565 RepID=A0A3B6ERR5_WHEAT|nr:aspartyl protease AED1-like [Triticum aestivum]KAF7026383.1 hypothetical protein CFC21_038494 [Triticum aestivum]